MKNWRVVDVMTTAVVTVPQSAPYRQVVDLLVSHRISPVPVVDEFQRVTGVVSEVDLLRMIEYAGEQDPRLFEGRRRRGDRGKATVRTAGELMGRPPVVVLRDTSLAAATRLMDSETVKRLPVVDDLGRVVGIVSRGDLLKIHMRTDDEILDDVESGVLRPILVEDFPTVQATVANGVVTLTGRVDRRASSDIADRLIRRILGVVTVVNELGHHYDDRQSIGTAIAFGIA
jgi:CBS-domain-containing membrane protein